ncbi:hypothetical protein ANN_24287 [Periplaneta americana]|uniref:Uncharacterized protein n=1 Tax=Periplaneta americana TaxID=6978 RepID=A0ABQ8S349_PERAM|nr:hypothetical protein ANN_24287 [Periplaneta americana]
MRMMNILKRSNESRLRIAANVLGGVDGSQIPIQLPSKDIVPVVYETPIDSEEDVATRIVCAVPEIRETPGVFARVRRSMVRRCNACLEVNGRRQVTLFPPHSTLEAGPWLRGVKPDQARRIVPQLQRLKRNVKSPRRQTKIQKQTRHERSWPHEQISLQNSSPVLTHVSIFTQQDGWESLLASLHSEADRSFLVQVTIMEIRDLIAALSWYSIHGSLTYEVPNLSCQLSPSVRGRFLAFGLMAIIDEKAAGVAQSVKALACRFEFAFGRGNIPVPILLYGREIWVLKQRDISRLRAAEMKYLRRTAGYTLLDHKRNEDILQELKMQPLEEKIAEYRNRWLEHISRMETGQTPQEMLKYHPQGQR